MLACEAGNGYVKYRFSLTVIAGVEQIQNTDLTCLLYSESLTSDYKQTFLMPKKENVNSNDMVIYASVIVFPNESCF